MGFKKPLNGGILSPAHCYPKGPSTPKHHDEFFSGNLQYPILKYFGPLGLIQKKAVNSRAWDGSGWTMTRL